ncbi:hypothetical protein KEM52_006392 [Ascosphaera acerosa]|nr:hypothetical protein KEM52_006392 [Ascosphaera acerosa]
MRHRRARLSGAAFPMRNHSSDEDDSDSPGESAYRARDAQHSRSSPTPDSAFDDLVHVPASRGSSPMSSSAAAPGSAAAQITSPRHDNQQTFTKVTSKHTLDDMHQPASAKRRRLSRKSEPSAPLAELSSNNLEPTSETASTPVQPSEPVAAAGEGERALPHGLQGSAGPSRARTPLPATFSTPAAGSGSKGRGRRSLSRPSITPRPSASAQRGRRTAKLNQGYSSSEESVLQGGEKDDGDVDVKRVRPDPDAPAEQQPPATPTRSASPQQSEHEVAAPIKQEPSTAIVPQPLNQVNDDVGAEHVRPTTAATAPAQSQAQAAHAGAAIDSNPTQQALLEHPGLKKLSRAQKRKSGRMQRLLERPGSSASMAGSQVSEQPPTTTAPADATAIRAVPHGPDKHAAPMAAAQSAARTQVARSRMSLPEYVSGPQIITTEQVSQSQSRRTERRARNTRKSMPMIEIRPPAIHSPGRYSPKLDQQIKSELLADTPSAVSVRTGTAEAVQAITAVPKEEPPSPDHSPIATPVPELSMQDASEAAHDRDSSRVDDSEELPSPADATTVHATAQERSQQPQSRHDAAPTHLSYPTPSPARTPHKVATTPKPPHSAAAPNDSQLFPEIMRSRSSRKSCHKYSTVQQPLLGRMKGPEVKWAAAQDDSPHTSWDEAFITKLPTPLGYLTDLANKLEHIFHANFKPFYDSYHCPSPVFSITTDEQKPSSEGQSPDILVDYFQDFRESCLARPLTSDHAARAMRYLVCLAIGSLQRYPHDYETAAQLFNLALSARDLLHHGDALLHAQTLYLAAQYHFILIHYDQAWVTLGAALSICQSEHVKLAHGQPSGADSSSRLHPDLRRVGLACTTLERQLAIHMGIRPNPLSSAPWMQDEHDMFTDGNVCELSIQQVSFIDRIMDIEAELRYPLGSIEKGLSRFRACDLTKLRSVEVGMLQWEQALRKRLPSVKPVTDSSEAPSPPADPLAISRKTLTLWHQYLRLRLLLPFFSLGVDLSTRGVETGNQSFNLDLTMLEKSILSHIVQDCITTASKVVRQAIDDSWITSEGVVHSALPRHVVTPALHLATKLLIATSLLPRSDMPSALTRDVVGELVDKAHILVTELFVAPPLGQGLGEDVMRLQSKCDAALSAEIEIADGSISLPDVTRRDVLTVLNSGIWPLSCA